MASRALAPAPEAFFTSTPSKAVTGSSSSASVIGAAHAAREPERLGLGLSLPTDEDEFHMMQGAALEIQDQFRASHRELPKEFHDFQAKRDAAKKIERKFRESHRELLPEEEDFHMMRGAALGIQEAFRNSRSASPIPEAEEFQVMRGAAMVIQGTFREAKAAGVFTAPESMSSWEQFQMARSAFETVKRFLSYERYTLEAAGSQVYGKPLSRGWVASTNLSLDSRKRASISFKLAHQARAGHDAAFGCLKLGSRRFRSLGYHEGGIGYTSHGDVWRDENRLAQGLRKVPEGGVVKMEWKPDAPNLLTWFLNDSTKLHEQRLDLSGYVFAVGGYDDDASFELVDSWVESNDELLQREAEAREAEEARARAIAEAEEKRRKEEASKAAFVKRQAAKAAEIAEALAREAHTQRSGPKPMR